MSTFNELQLLPSLVHSLTEQGLTTPTEIQARTLPALLRGAPLVGVSETGSGKTLAYALPMLQRLKELENTGSPVEDPSRPRGLVLVPGRELGEQVGRVFKTLTHHTRLRVRTVLGGTKKQIARQNVAGNLEILVATPGRLEQLLATGPLRLDDVRMVVFDEADQLLDPGFLPVARRLLTSCPREVQLVMFSATLPGRLDAALNELYRSPPERVRTHGSRRVVSTLRTDNRMVSYSRRLALMVEVIAEAPKVGTLIFANTRGQCEAIGQALEEAGVSFVAYMGQMDRQERRVNLARFRDAEVSVLLTTDLGGRGLDIARVDRVVNVHLPKDVNAYLHRVGRTARAGRAGLVVNLVTEADRALFTRLERRTAQSTTGRKGPRRAKKARRK